MKAGGFFDGTPAEGSNGIYEGFLTGLTRLTGLWGSILTGRHEIHEGDRGRLYQFSNYTK
jgi:hypothetical protein